MTLLLKLYIRSREELDTLARRDRGASAVEYGLLVAAIAAVIILVIFALGDNIKSLFSNTCTALKSNASAAGKSCS